ncbi:hypothetical protein TNCV_3929021 [Trichonephila clavipes]|nr:hypothetical protein TNCV_3929021 [Trichonephila clavipes]
MGRKPRLVGVIGKKIMKGVLSSGMKKDNKRVRTSSRWCGLVVRRGGMSAQVSSSSLDHGSKLRGPSPKTLE